MRKRFKALGYNKRDFPHSSINSKNEVWGRGGNSKE